MYICKCYKPTSKVTFINQRGCNKWWWKFTTWKMQIGLDKDFYTNGRNTGFWLVTIRGKLLTLIISYTNSLNFHKTFSKYLFRHTKSKSMVIFYILNALGQNFWNCCKMPKPVISCNLSKNGCVWITQWPTFSKLKTKFCAEFLLQ